MNTLIYITEDIDKKKRLDLFICEKTGWTRSLSKKHIEEEKVKINGKVCTKSSYRISENEQVIIEEIEITSTNIAGQKIDVDIIYEDEDVIIVDKPRGMVVHPGNGNSDGTLVNSLLFTHKDKLSQINGCIRPGIVHRIDKDTSGILVVAKNDNAHKKLSEQFKVHSIRREYIALVCGIVEKDKLKINLPIGRDPVNRLKMAVVSKNSKEAITNIEVVKRFYNFNMTLVKARLETGRTHQIRVHMSYIGHPLVGDKLYKATQMIPGLEGQMLHAAVLGFNHPTTCKYIEFDRKVPEYFEKVIQGLENNESRS